MVSKAETAAERQQRWEDAFCALPEEARVSISLDVGSACAMLGALQLALRIQRFGQSETARLIRVLCDQLIDLIVATAADQRSIREALEAGNRPEYDEPAAAKKVPGFCSFCHERICDDATNVQAALLASRTHAAKCKNSPISALVTAAEGAATYLGQLIQTVSCQAELRISTGVLQTHVDALLAGIAGCTGELDPTQGATDAK